MSGEEWKTEGKERINYFALSIQQTWRRVNGSCCCEAKNQGDGDTSYQLISRVDLLKMDL